MTPIQKAVIAIGIVAMSVSIVCIGVAMYFLIQLGMDRNELMECNKWRVQSLEFSNFFLLKWQKEQCDSHGILINAPLK